MLLVRTLLLSLGALSGVCYLLDLHKVRVCCDVNEFGKYYRFVVTYEYRWPIGNSAAGAPMQLGAHSDKF